MATNPPITVACGAAPAGSYPMLVRRLQERFETTAHYALLAESRSFIELRSFIARLLGWAADKTPMVDFALRSIRLAATRRLPLVLCGPGDQLAQAFAHVLGDRNRSVLRQRDRGPPRPLVAIGLDQAQHAKTRGQLPSPMPCDGALQFLIALGEPLHDEVIHEGFGGSFQRLPLLGVRPPDGSIELLRSSYDGDGKRQALAQALDHRRSLRDLARDQLCLVVEDEAHDALGFFYAL